MSTPVFDVTKSPYNAAGNGSTDDSSAIKSALRDAHANSGCVYFPPGIYYIGSEIRYENPAGTKALMTNKVSFKGDGPNVSVLKVPSGVKGLNLYLNQPSGTTLQQNNVQILDLGFRASGTAGTAISIGYGTFDGSGNYVPALAVNDHFEPAVVIRNIEVRSASTSAYFANGVDINSAWNVTMSDCYLSGSDAGAVWANLTGSGIALHRTCVNSHFSNCHCNFWAYGFYYDTGTGSDDHNTEGLFFANCSFVAVGKGLFITANPNYMIGALSVPRVTGITWVGGLIETRNPASGGGSAIHLVRCDAVNFAGAMITSQDANNDFAFFLDTCNMVSVTGCNLYTFTYGVLTTGTCKAIVSAGCTFENVANQIVYSPSTTQSRSYGHVRNGSLAFSEIDQNGTNKFGWV